MAIDRMILEWLNRMAASHHQLTTLAVWSAQNVVTVIAITTVVGWLLSAVADARSHRSLRWQILECAAVAAVALLVGLSLNQLIGHAWFRPRPSDALSEIVLLLPRSGDPSFPSDHATAGFAIALAVSLALPRLGILLIVETAILGISRIAVGLHYPSDILGGLLTALIGVGIGQAVLRGARAPLMRLAAGHSRLVPLHSELPPPLLRTKRLYLLCVAAAFFALPVLLELTVDPIHFGAEPMEVGGWIVAACVLGTAAGWCTWFVIRTESSDWSTGAGG